MFLVVQLLYAIRLKSRTKTLNEIHVSFYTSEDDLLVCKTAQKEP